LIDAGASVVVGHHPHVPQGLLRHGRGLIACSLGDFLFDLPRSSDDMNDRQRSFNRLHPILEVRLDDRGVADHRVFWLTRDSEGRHVDAAGENSSGLDPAREFERMCQLLQDERMFHREAHAVYRAELYQVFYTVYAAFYLALRRKQPDMLRWLPWWLSLFHREPRRRLVEQGLVGAGCWAIERLFGRKPEAP
jgi:poly-gamma-glutamate synthesis protein (capsule biosynthesis protein)